MAVLVLRIGPLSNLMYRNIADFGCMQVKALKQTARRRGQKVRISQCQGPFTQRDPNEFADTPAGHYRQEGLGTPA